MAGQSVPHVHLHLIPRRSADFVPNDDIYDAIEASESDLPKAQEAAAPKHDLKVADEDRKARTREDMEKETIWLQGLFDNE